MKFGQVQSAKGIDFTLPKDDVLTKETIVHANYKGRTKIYVGCSRWGKADLHNFYPRGTKDELEYYAKNFNSIEMNASFYRIFPNEQFRKWADKTPENFRFAPKVYQGLSHWKRLEDCESYIAEYAQAVSGLGEKLGMCFMQMHNNFAPNQENIARLEPFLQQWSATKLPLAIELRHTDWYNHQPTADYLFNLFEKYKITSIITDTAGRRDLVHMRLTTNTAFIRYVAGNLDNDYSRAVDWANRIEQWVNLGIETVYFFVHQNTEQESVHIAKHFINSINQKLSFDLKTPEVIPLQTNLF